MGDDIDSTILIDKEGFIYVVAHADHEKTNNTAAQAGARGRPIGEARYINSRNEPLQP